MEVINEKIWTSCYSLSIGLMWEKEQITDNLILSHMAELNTMAEDFYKIAMWHIQNIEDQQEAESIIVSLIKYIDTVHAIPPLRGNTQWFDHTLTVLVELAAPNSALSRSDAKVLDYFEQGIADYKESIYEDEDDFEDKL